MKIPLLIAALLCLATPAWASVAPPTTTESKDGEYGYRFSDDPLNALGSDVTVAQLKVRPPPKRVTLIRPRTSFVMALFKSTEEL
jgi:hypothetical protein